MDKEVTKQLTVFGNKAKITKTSLELLNNISYEEWLKVGGVLKEIGGAVHWWWGDWIRQGDKEWGKTYIQAEKETGFDNETLRHDKWVASKVDPCRRRHNLSFSHHIEIAKFTPEEQVRWLDKAEKEKLNSKELRKLIKEEKYKEQPPIIANANNQVGNKNYREKKWKKEERTNFRR